MEMSGNGERGDGYQPHVLRAMVRIWRDVLMRGISYISQAYPTNFTDSEGPPREQIDRKEEIDRDSVGDIDRAYRDMQDSHRVLVGRILVGNRGCPTEVVIRNRLLFPTPHALAGDLGESIKSDGVPATGGDTAPTDGARSPRAK